MYVHMYVQTNECFITIIHAYKYIYISDPKTILISRSILYDIKRARLYSKEKTLIDFTN